jgi:glucokinase
VTSRHASTASGSCRLGVDLGGTRIKAVALGDGGAVLARAQAPTPREGADAVLMAMAGLARHVAGGRTIRSVGVAVPGVVDMVGGRTLFLPNILGEWTGRPVAADLAAALSAPAALLNDARAAAYGELRVGAGRGCRDFILMAVGTGIGGGVVLGGRLHFGADGHAGEVGHQTIDMHGPRCGCGNRGCGEALASGPALVAAAARAVLQGWDTALRQACAGDVGRLTPRMVAEAAAAGDRAAGEVLGEVAERLGTLAANLVVVLNPRRVIIGGGLAQAGGALLNGVRQTLEGRAGWYLRHAPVEVVPAELGEEAGALGAAAWAAEAGQVPG